MTRLLLLGLDGGTDSVIGLADARLPNIHQLRHDGATCSLRSTVPPITSAAWASMLTGWNPGRHGMYDFRAIDISSYSSVGAGQSGDFAEDAAFVSSARWRGAAVWDVAATDHASVSCVPMTYPTWEIAGEMVAGFPLPDYSRNHSTPAAAGARLPLMLEGADRMADMSDQQLAHNCQLLVDRQAAVVREWLADDGPELMVAVFQGTDFAQHRLWKYLDQPGHPLREALLDLYRTIDDVVGEARAALAADGVVMVASDHGFGPHPRTFVRTNSVLAGAGLLAVSGGGGERRSAAALGRAPRLRRRLRLLSERLPDRARGWLADRYTGAHRIDWSSTRAFRFPLYAPADGIVVNLRGRQSDGAVAPGEQYERTRDEVIEALEGLRDGHGQPVVEWARRREDLYTGTYLEAAPDVIALFHPAYKGAAGLGEAFAPVPQAILDRYSGVHAMDGVFAAAGAGIRPGVQLGQREIVDVAPTILALLGMSPADPCDGVVMRDALVGTVQSSAAANGRAPGADHDPALSPQERDALERSLRSLGYLE